MKLYGCARGFPKEWSIRCHCGSYTCSSTTIFCLWLWNKSVISQLWQKIAHTPWHILNYDRFSGKICWNLYQVLHIFGMIVFLLPLKNVLMYGYLSLSIKSLIFLADGNSISLKHESAVLSLRPGCVSPMWQSETCIHVIDGILTVVFQVNFCLVSKFLFRIPT